MDHREPPTAAPLPRISVVVPTFNSAAYLAATLESILAQDYPDLEVIVVDGASTDGTVDIIRRYAGRLASWVSEPDRGQCDAINKGFARATGELRCWTNADDLLEPGALRHAAAQLDDPSRPQWLVGAARLIDAAGRPRGVRAPRLIDDDTFLLWALRWTPSQATFWNRSMWEAAGPLDEDLHYVMDFALWWRMHRVAPAVVSDRVLGTYRLHAASKSLVAVECSRRERRAQLAAVVAADMTRAEAGGEAARRALAERYATLIDDLADRGAMLERMRRHRLMGPVLRLYRRLAPWSPELET